MDFKLLKLNLKIGWLKLTGKLQKISDGNDFPSISIDSPHILIVLPIDKQLIPKSMNCISSIVDLYKDRDAQFSFIINNKGRGPAFKNKAGRKNLPAGSERRMGHSIN